MTPVLRCQGWPLEAQQDGLRVEGHRMERVPNDDGLKSAQDLPEPRPILGVVHLEHLPGWRQRLEVRYGGTSVVASRDPDRHEIGTELTEMLVTGGLHV